MPANRPSRPLCILTVLLLTAVLLAACGDDGEGGGALTVTDALDRSVQLDGSPERITVAGRAALQVVDALYLFPEGRERLGALGKRGEGIAPLLAIVDANWGEKTILEQNAGAEQIAPTTPDLVIAKSAMAEELGPPLDAVAIPAFYVDLQTPEQFERDVTALGEVLGDPDRAGEILAFYQEHTDLIADAPEGLAADARPSVLLIEYSDEEGTVAFSGPPAGRLPTPLGEPAGGGRAR